MNNPLYRCSLPLPFFVESSVPIFFLQDDLPAWSLQGEQPDELLQAGGKRLALRHPSDQPQNHGCGEWGKVFRVILAILRFRSSESWFYIFFWFLWCFQPPKSSSGNGANPSDKVALVLHRQVAKITISDQLNKKQKILHSKFFCPLPSKTILLRVLLHVTDLWVWPAPPMEERSQLTSSSQSFSGNFSMIGNRCIWWVIMIF